MPVTSTAVDLDRPSVIHIVNVAGKAMSAMAEILLAMGHTVSGYDPKELPVLNRLRALGVTITTGEDFVLPPQVELVGYSTATPLNHPILDEARRRGIPMIARPALQGAIAHTRRTIAVSGTHGKTTTTAMLVHILLATNQNPSYIVGGDFGRDIGGVAWSDGEWLIIEADESDGTFLGLGAEHVVVTNVDDDHLDFYGSRQALKEAFATFISNAPGTKIVGTNSDTARELVQNLAVLSFGTRSDAEARIENLRPSGASISFGLALPDRQVVAVTIPEPGLHNALNATAAILAAGVVGVDPADAARALVTYPGVSRRFERKGTVGGIEVVDDYAHNPGKVQAVVEAAAQGDWRRVVVVFQPHRYSRTADLGHEFGPSFAAADVVVVTAIDPAGEPVREGITGALVVDAIQNSNPQVEVYSVEEPGNVLPTVMGILRPGDICLTLGAGSITYFGDELLASLEAEAPRQSHHD